VQLVLAIVGGSLIRGDCKRGKGRWSGARIHRITILPFLSLLYAMNTVLLGKEEKKERKKSMLFHDVKQSTATDSPSPINGFPILSMHRL